MNICIYIYIYIRWMEDILHQLKQGFIRLFLGFEQSNMMQEFFHTQYAARRGEISQATLVGDGPVPTSMNPEIWPKTA